MVDKVLPRHLRKAVERLEADPARAWTVGEIAAGSGVAPRTLQRQFRRFLGCLPMQFVRDLRLDRARSEVLRATAGKGVTEIAMRCGFNHFGRFAAQYRQRYGECPSVTLRKQATTISSARLPSTPVLGNRPMVAVLPFELLGAGADAFADFTDETTAALMRARWIAVSDTGTVRYQLRGKVRGDESGRLRVTAMLIDSSRGRHLWAGAWNGLTDELPVLAEQVAAHISSALQPALRESEIDRAWQTDPCRLDAWGLTMRALRYVVSVDGTLELGLELLEQAIELAPRDPLPVALAAWCHGLRGGHNFCPSSEDEKSAARALAERAVRLGSSDALTETFISAGYTLAHDLARAAIHADRALALDGGCAWAWGRRGWVHAYCGETQEAIECFQTARSLAPGDRLDFLWSVGIAAGHFDAAQYDAAARWFERALAENPGANWINHVLAPTYALANQVDNASRSFAEFTAAFPDVRIGHVRSGLPYRPDFLDRITDGLESLGMPY